MFRVKEVKFQRRYPGYIYRREVIDDSEVGGSGNLEMVVCYSPQGKYIGPPKMARHLCKDRGLRDLQPADPEGTVCNIGFQAREKKWYGWSHRAICGFGIGDRVFEEEYGDDDTPYTRHGSVTIETLDQAKESAIAFAKSVS